MCSRRTQSFPKESVVAENNHIKLNDCDEYEYTESRVKAAYSVTMNIFRKKNIFLLNHL